MSDRFAPLGTPSPNSRFIGLGEALRGSSSRLLNHRLNTYSRERAEAEGSTFFQKWQALRQPGMDRAQALSASAGRKVTTSAAPPITAKVAPASPHLLKPTAEQRAAREAQQRRQAEAEAARRKAEAQAAAERREAEIAESWRKAHAQVAAQLGLKEPEKADDPQANHGWAVIHAAIRLQRGY